MTKKRCLKLMMSHLSGRRAETMKLYRYLNSMLEQPVRRVDLLWSFHAVACSLYMEAGDAETAHFATLEMQRLQRLYGAGYGVKVRGGEDDEAEG